MSTIAYMRNFLKDPDVASLTPTPSWCVKSITRSMKLDEANVVLEYGPGMGTFTRYILSKMPKGSLLIAIEKNDDFASFLDGSIQDDRFRLISGSAVDAVSHMAKMNIDKVDYVISGIPFSFFPSALQHELVGNTASLLSESGSFVIYQSLFQITRKGEPLLAVLNTHFERVLTGSEWLCVPPLSVYKAHSPIRNPIGK